MTAVEWFAKQVLRSRQLGFISNEKFNELLEQAKEMEKEQKNNLPIHIQEEISNTHVYIDDGIVHVKPFKTFKSE